MKTFDGSGLRLRARRDGTLEADLRGNVRPGRSWRPLAVLAVLAVLLAVSALCSGCMTARLEKGGLALKPVATCDEVDAVAEHLNKEAAALRAEYQAADVAIRADLTAGDAQTRVDAQKALDEGHAAYEKALADGKTALEAERAKYEAAVKTALDLASAAKGKADEATNAAAASTASVNAEAGAREKAFRDLLAAFQASRLTPDMLKGVLDDPIKALTTAAGNIGKPDSNPVRDYGPLGAILLAMAGGGYAMKKSGDTSGERHDQLVEALGTLKETVASK